MKMPSVRASNLMPQNLFVGSRFRPSRRTRARLDDVVAVAGLPMAMELAMVFGLPGHEIRALMQGVIIGAQPRLGPNKFCSGIATRRP